MNAAKVKESLFSLTSKGIKYDLERIAAAAAKIGNPHKSYPSFHIAGTNGKGSTCSFIESILRCNGFKTALFTSPHLLAFEERFRINGQPVSEGEWLDVYAAQERIIFDFKLTFFEASMLIAIELFRRHSVDWAVFETGMGGRLDATNIIHPEVSVITRLAMDHHEYLGNTIEQIAAEKLGIVKQSVPLVAMLPPEESVRQQFVDTCKRHNSPCFFVSEALALAENIRTTLGETSFTYNAARYTTSMTGRFQVHNALCSLAAIDHSPLSIAPEILQQGISLMQLPGRFEQIKGYSKTIIIDVGHNPDAATVFCAALNTAYPDQDVCIVTGIMADKEYAPMLKLYAQHASHLIITQPSIDRAASAERLAQAAPAGKFTIIPDIADAVHAALDRPEQIVAIVGSFHTVGEALEVLKNFHT